MIELKSNNRIKEKCPYQRSYSFERQEDNFDIPEREKYPNTQPI